MQIRFCANCGFSYDERFGIPSAAIPPATRWADVPDDWRCPNCAMPKSAFGFSATRLDQPSGARPRELSSSPCFMHELDWDDGSVDS